MTQTLLVGLGFSALVLLVGFVLELLQRGHSSPQRRALACATVGYAALAGVLLHDTGFAKRWLGELLGRDPGGIVDVATQRTFRTADEVARTRRPDLWVTTSTGLALVEAKIDAPETTGQLREYWKHLNAVTDKKWKALIFLTPNARVGSASLVSDDVRSFRATSWGTLAQTITGEDEPWTLDFKLVLTELHMTDEPVSLVSAAKRLAEIPCLARALDDALEGAAWDALEKNKDLIETPKFVRDGLVNYGYFGYCGKVKERSIWVSMGIQLSTPTPQDVPIPEDAQLPLARMDIEAWDEDREELARRLPKLGDQWHCHPTDPTLMREFIAYSWVPLSTLVTAGKVLERGQGLPWFPSCPKAVLRWICAVGDVVESGVPADHSGIAKRADRSVSWSQKCAPRARALKLIPQATPHGDSGFTLTQVGSAMRSSQKPKGGDSAEKVT